MFDGRDGDDRGDVDREEDRGGGADPGLAVEAERGEQRPAGGELDRPGAELRRGGERAPAAGRGRPRGRPGPGPAPGAARAPSLASRPLPLRRVSIGATSTTSSTTSGTKLKAKSFWVLEWKRSVVETMITPSRTQGDDVEQRLRDERAEEDGEGLAHAAGPARERERPGRLAEAGRQRRRHQHADHRRRGHVAAADRAVGQRRAARSSTRRRRGRRARGPSAPRRSGPRSTSERTMLSTTLSTPILRAASTVRPTPSAPATPRPTRRATRRLRLPLRASGGSSEGSRCAGRRRVAVGGPEPGPGGEPFARRVTGSGASIARS